MNSDGSYFYENESYKLAELKEVQEFMEKYGFKSYWNKETYEWFLYNDSFFQIMMYEEWGSPIINFCYVPEKKSRNYNVIFYDEGNYKEEDGMKIYKKVKGIVDERGSILNREKSEIYFLSAIEEMMYHCENLPFDEDLCRKLFSTIECPVNGQEVFFAQDRMRQTGIRIEN